MPFIGKASNPEGPIGAGIDSLVIQDGRLVTFATDMTINQDHMLEPVRVLGVHFPLFFKSMGYNATIEVGTFVIREKDHPGALYTPGFQADGTYNLNTAGDFDFTIADVDTYSILSTAIRCKMSNESQSHPLQGMNTRSTSWMATKVLPGLQVS